MQESKKDEVTDLLLREILAEKRADRRWKNIRFLLGFLLISYLVIGILYLSSDHPALSDDTSGKYVSLVRVDGMIAPGRDFSAEVLLPVLKKAFADKHAVGVVIDIDSPGGTPVQSAIIHDAILSYKKRYNKRVIVVGEDQLTSGAYFVAVAADKIYVNPNTLAGSIGVIMKGFGFVDMMKKIGVDRRVYTAGDSKDRMDPFLPQNPEDVKKIQQVMGEVHANFVRAVVEGRKGKLHADTAVLFSGDFWSGQTALKLGLVDGLGNLMDATDKEFGTTRYKEYEDKSSLSRLFTGGLTSAMDTVIYS